MNKKNQYKFLYDVLGNSIIVENLINEDCSENNQKGNILINPKKEQYLKFTFFNNFRDNSKDNIVTLYFKSRIIKDDPEGDSKKEKTKIYIDTDTQHLLRMFNKDIQNEKNKNDKSKNNGSETKDNSEENNNSVNNIIDEEDRKYILYNLFYGNKDVYLKYQKSSYNENEDDNVNIENIDIEQISNDLRGYSTLKASNTNSYIGKSFFFIICERGFVVYDIWTDVRRYHNIAILFLLAIAYNLKMDDFLKNGAELYNKHRYDIEKIIELQESIHAFNLQFFFGTPVKMDRHRLCSLWNIIAENYNIKTKHDEVNTQVLELTKLLENRKSQTFNTNIALIGIILAVAPFVIEITKFFIKESDIAGKLIVYLSTIIIAIITLMRSFIWRKIKNILNIVQEKK